METKVCKKCGERFVGRCQQCKKVLDFDNWRKPNAFELDHIIPVSKGGETMVHNLIPVCRQCNSKKGDRNCL